MNNHILITIKDIQPEQSDLLVAHLSEAGFEGFEEGDHELKAYISQKGYDKKLLQEMAFKYQVAFEEQLIPEQNWNALWESNFHPVIIDEFVGIRAHFHAPLTSLEHEIIITPKMSFGTGHHATTSMMIRMMKEIDFNKKLVFDFGTGTGVLAILAEKLGAEKVIAVDIDEWSISNAEENIQHNGCTSVDIVQKNNAEMAAHFDIILANINKNVILDNFSSLIGQLNVNGTLVLSGLLEEDEVDILLQANKYSLVLKGKSTDRGWIALRFNY